MARFTTQETRSLFVAGNIGYPIPYKVRERFTSGQATYGKEETHDFTDSSTWAMGTTNNTWTLDADNDDMITVPKIQIMLTKDVVFHEYLYIDICSDISPEMSLTVDSISDLDNYWKLLNHIPANTDGNLTSWLIYEYDVPANKQRLYGSNNGSGVDPYRIQVGVGDGTSDTPIKNTSAAQPEMFRIHFPNIKLCCEPT